MAHESDPDQQLLAGRPVHCDFAGDDPVNESDPMGLSVNLQGVANWAFANVGGSTDGYRDDCTDFASRALLLGGGDQESRPRWLNPGTLAGMGVLAAKAAVRLARTDNQYWFKFGYDIFLTAESNSWADASDLADHLKLIGSRFLVNAATSPSGSASCSTSGNSWGEVGAGDLIFANWSGSSPQGIDHTGVVLGWGSASDKSGPWTSWSPGSDLWIAQHSVPIVQPLSDWINYGSNTHVWVAVPNEG